MSTHSNEPTTTKDMLLSSNTADPVNVTDNEGLARIWNEWYSMRCKAVELVVQAKGQGLPPETFKTEVNKMYNYLITGKYE